MRVYKLMTPDVVSVRPDAPLRDVARLLAERGISGVPVLDESDRVLGVISEGDIMAMEAPPAPPRSRLLALLFHQETASAVSSTLLGRTAAEAMSAPPITVEPDCPVTQAAALMAEREVNRLPVVDNRKRLVGILSRADVVRAHARSDEEIEKEIAADIVLHGIFVPPGTVDVSVTNGAVTLVGEVESKGKADLLALFVRRVPGVVSVESHVTWRQDKHAPSGIRAPA
jgi:CBS domain-containing protein